MTFGASNEIMCKYYADRFKVPFEQRVIVLPSGRGETEAKRAK